MSFAKILSNTDELQWVDWLIEHGLTSAQTQYRLYGRRFSQVKRPNQQCQSTEGGWLVIQTGLSLTRLTSPCYNTTARMPSSLNGPKCCTADLWVGKCTFCPGPGTWLFYYYLFIITINLMSFVWCKFEQEASNCLLQTITACHHKWWSLSWSAAGKLFQTVVTYWKITTVLVKLPPVSSVSFGPRTRNLVFAPRWIVVGGRSKSGSPAASCCVRPE